MGEVERETETEAERERGKEGEIEKKREREHFICEDQMTFVFSPTLLRFVVLRQGLLLNLKLSVGLTG